MGDVFQETEIEPQVETAEQSAVFHWRLEQLELAGYDQCSAIELAGRQDVDLHVALELRLQGCPPDTAVRILS